MTFCGRRRAPPVDPTGIQPDCWTGTATSAQTIAAAKKPAAVNLSGKVPKPTVTLGVKVTDTGEPGLRERVTIIDGSRRINTLTLRSGSAKVKLTTIFGPRNETSRPCHRVHAGGGGGQASGLAIVPPGRSVPRPGCGVRCSGGLEGEFDQEIDGKANGLCKKRHRHSSSWRFSSR
ncbi:hypothetical protein GCM10022236_10110 [Microlunatus ginsengisoli]|uniref:Uncharacterized protein n=1 Tax=Microlunatus ginsengisoli TaxID=363863 RepID=A0ABP6ZLY9_9ACTN